MSERKGAIRVFPPPCLYLLRANLLSLMAALTIELLLETPDLRLSNSVDRSADWPLDDEPELELDALEDESPGW